METLAYLYAAQEYECPEEKEINLTWINSAAITLLGITCAAWIVSLASAVQAATVFHGDSGADVTRLQDLLRNAGYFPAATTGYFGEFTEAAVQDFQHARGLAVDGVAGYETFAALEKNSGAVALPAPAPTVRPPTPSINAPNASINVNLPNVNLPAVRPVVRPVTRPAVISTGSTTLGFGDSGPQVTRLQDLLRRSGYLTGPSTGVFGAATRNAVERFQQRSGIAVSGFADSTTIAALENAPAGTIQ
jgi:peptidoglycan hydrolase-like protein with peptidoglycan-binding domain